jgi:hypothetical protein
VPSASRTLDLFGDDSLPEGFRYQADFLSGKEEHSLLEHIKVLPGAAIGFAPLVIDFDLRPSSPEMILPS